MIRRYVTIARYSADLDTECPDIGQALTVFEPDATPRRTGILDARGNPLFAIDKMAPIGFVSMKFKD